MKRSRLLSVVFTCAILFVCASVKAARVLDSSSNASVTLLGSGPGFTTLDVDVQDNNGSWINFENLGALEDNFTISLRNSTGTPWSDIKFEFIGAGITNPITIMPVTGTLIGADYTPNSAWLFFAPPEDVALNEASGTIVTTQFYTLAITPNAVPIPSAVWLFGSGLIGLVGLARRKKV